MLTLSALETDKPSDDFTAKLLPIRSSCVQTFLNTTRKYALLHHAFAAALLVQVLLFAIFFSLLAASAMVALCIGVFFLSLFSYLVLRFYFDAKKPDFFLSIKEEFLTSSAAIFGIEASQGSLLFARGLQKFANDFNHLEYKYYDLGTGNFAVLLQKLSAYLHWNDVLQIKTLLYHTSIEQYLLLIKETPTDVELHAALAETYVALAQVYSPPSSVIWFSTQYFSPAIMQKWKASCNYAIEELKIICDYLPNDPWAHAKLAAIYHQLHSYNQEIHEYETILQLCPNDADVLFRLGALYFQQGHTGKGLKIYERMKKGKFAKANELIHLYDANFQTK